MKRKKEKKEEKKKEEKKKVDEIRFYLPYSISFPI